MKEMEFVMPNRTLEATLQYRCPAVIAHFRRYHFNLTEAEAEDVFVEMLRWLWLCGRAYEDRQQSTSHHERSVGNGGHRPAVAFVRASHPSVCNVL
jgi:hypothetical protein